MKIIKTKIIVLLVMAFFVFLPVLPAFAQVMDTPDTGSNSKGLIVSPSIIEEVIKPGQDSKIKLEIKNPSHIPLPIKSYICEFDASDEVGGVEFDEDPDSDRLAMPNWGRIEDPDFVLQPNATREVEVILSTPNDLPPGGYYSTIFFEILVPEKFYDASSLEIGGRVGALLFLVAEGDIVQKGKVSELKILNNILSNGPAQAEVKFSNTGNVHLRPSGKIEIKNMITGSTKTLEISNYTVLPQKTRKIETILNDIYWPGLYQIKVVEQYGRDKNVTTSQTNFFYLQLHQSLVIIIMLLVLIAILSPKLRKRIAFANKIIIHGS